MECNLKKNLEHCTCTYEPCSRKGKCCECVTYHRLKGEIPGCFFSREAEAEFDRSIEFFLKTAKDC